MLKKMCLCVRVCVWLARMCGDSVPRACMCQATRGCADGLACEGVRLRWRPGAGDVCLAELLLLGLEPSSRACLSLSLSLSLSLTRDASEYSLGAYNACEPEPQSL